MISSLLRSDLENSFRLESDDPRWVYYLIPEGLDKAYLKPKPGASGLGGVNLVIKGTCQGGKQAMLNL